MIVGVFWYLQQWDRIHSPFYAPVAEEVFSGNRGVLAAIPYAFVTGAAPAAMMGLTPYHFLFNKPGEWAHTASMLDDELRSVKHIAHHFPKLGPLNRKAVKRMVARKLLLKVGSRFIPYVGLALLMVDAWHVGKWIGEKTSPF